jgi:hypothetical protein
MSETLLSPNFLFRFAVSCRRRDPVWSKRGIKLNDDYLVPSFSELDGRTPFADLRVAWSDKGLSFVASVNGKMQNLWCRSTRVEDSDGLQVWIDTRDTHNIHRASRFCHRFAFLPTGVGQDKNDPMGRLLPINRAREEPKSVGDNVLQVRSVIRNDGYDLQAHIPAKAMTGFDPAEHRRLGFFYAVIDRELGWQTFSLGAEFPFSEDPSLWGTLELA